MQSGFKLSEVLHHLLRDVGIGFIVAVVVTIIYELYSRSVSDRENMGSILQTIYGYIIHGDIWDEVTDQVIGKTVIRQKAHVKLKVEDDDSELNQLGQAVLWMEFRYELNGLKSSTLRNVEVNHLLDDHIINKKKNLPRFEKVIVGSRKYDGLDLTPKIKGLCFTDVIPELQARDVEPVPIIMERRELIYMPGSYYLLMNELTKGVTVELEPLPRNMMVEVETWPRKGKGGRLRLEPQKLWPFDEHIILPGQGLEFRFKKL